MPLPRSTLGQSFWISAAQAARKLARASSFPLPWQLASPLLGCRSGFLLLGRCDGDFRAVLQAAEAGGHHAFGAVEALGDDRGRFGLMRDGDRAQAHDGPPRAFCTT